MSWAQRLKRVFGIDIENCAACGGRAHVRRTLYMATLVATRHNPVIRAHYQQLLSRGKAKKSALVACMRKLLVILNTMAKTGEHSRLATADNH